jgi:NADH-quinone oxidoreductase subunit A
MFLIFDVELVFLYPWAVLFPRLQAEPGSEHHAWAQAMAEAGYGPGFMLVAGGVFFGLLLVGFVYEWRRGVFKWN